MEESTGAHGGGVTVGNRGQQWVDGARPARDLLEAQGLMPQASSSAWDGPERHQVSTPWGDWDPSAGFFRRPSLSPGDGTFRGGLLQAPGKRRQVQASQSPCQQPPVPTWVTHTTPSVYLSHSLTPMGASASQQLPRQVPFPFRTRGITGPELPWSLPPMGLPSHPGQELLSPLCGCPHPVGQSKALSSVLESLASLRAQKLAPVCLASRPRADGGGASPSELGLWQPVLIELVLLHFLPSKLGAG